MPNISENPYKDNVLPQFLSHAFRIFFKLLFAFSCYSLAIFLCFFFEQKDFFDNETISTTHTIQKNLALYFLLIFLLLFTPFIYYSLHLKSISYVKQLKLIIFLYCQKRFIINTLISSALLFLGFTIKILILLIPVLFKSNPKLFDLFTYIIVAIVLVLDFVLGLLVAIYFNFHLLFCAGNKNFKNALSESVQVFKHSFVYLFFAIYFFLVLLGKLLSYFIFDYKEWLIELMNVDGSITYLHLFFLSLPFLLVIHFLLCILISIPYIAQQKYQSHQMKKI